MRRRQPPDFPRDAQPGWIHGRTRTSADPRALVSAVRGQINAIDSQLAIESIATLNDHVGEVVAPRRFSAMTLGVFATGSLMLAAIGLYGLAFNVAERREIAVRLALGPGLRSFGWLSVRD
jgi:hypothetical protein